MNESLAAKPIPVIPEPAQQQLFSVSLPNPASMLCGSSMVRHQGGP
jgi:hypothetical protein